MSYKALYVSPVIPSFSMDETVAFFTGVLGFVLVFQSATYRIVERNGLTIHVLPAANDAGQMELYMEVDDADMLWQQIKDKLAAVTHTPPFDREYKMREIHIAIPQTNTLLLIGQSI